jgi:ribosomal protein S12 methylthiotransferase
LRGGYASRRIEDIVSETRKLTSGGPTEIILAAQDTTRYGLDIYSEPRLCELIEELSVIENVKWIRLLYSYPDMIDDRLINAIGSNNKVLKYLDIPIQHASDHVLKAMNRRYGGEQLRQLIIKLRQEIPGIVLRTSLITGFPGETEDDFECLKVFVKESGFERLGVFAYSREEGTPAAEFKKQVSARIAARRRAEILALQQGIAAEKEKSRIGCIYEAIVDSCNIIAGRVSGGKGEGEREGVLNYGMRTYAEAPGIDGIVQIMADRELDIGDFVNIKITNKNYKGLRGVLSYESTK